MTRRLSELLPEHGITDDIAIQGLSDDSRNVGAGDLFIAARGLNFDARSTIPQVALKPVAAICCEAPYEYEAVNVPLFEVADLSREKGLIASRFYGAPSTALTLVAVTGTNGKTSCSQFVAESLTRLKRPCAMVGTMGYGAVDALKSPGLSDLSMPGESTPGLTTPDAIKLQSIFSELVEEDYQAVCVEASSHGLSQGRLNGSDIDVAVFTNITRDHLDYHATFEHYKRAKAKLFTWPGLKAAVVNLDDAFCEELTGLIDPEVKLYRYSLQNSNAEIVCSNVTYHADGIESKVMTPWGQLQLRLGILGDFNLSNILAVIGVLGSLDYSAQQIEMALSHLRGVRGRMEVIQSDVGPTVVIDYAHTPDALEKAIQALRRHTQSDIWTVMGCGGDRDRGKRALMGEVGARLSEHLIVTDDNPRFEDSAAIIDDILSGDFSRRNVLVESDRSKAITHAIAQASRNDIVLVAGKGHEEYQDIKGERRIYSDHNVVAAALKSASDRAKRPKIIIGLGKTGYACAQYFARNTIPFSVMDDAKEPAYLEQLHKTLPDIQVGTINGPALLRASEIVLSPGVPLSLAPVQSAIAAGIPVTGDIAMFANLVEQPLIAITGSNGKTTVTDLLGFMLRKAGMNPGVGGNIGTPSLDLLDQGFDSYILEVSSYQLEVVSRLSADIAVVLNLAPDHLNRYGSVDDYYAAKLKIYQGCKVAILNRALGNVPLATESSFLDDVKLADAYSFGSDLPQDNQALGIRIYKGQYYLAKGDKNLLDTDDLSIKGRHNWQNALAVLAIGTALNLDDEVMVEALRTYPGLPHRCEWLGTLRGVDYYNDSKSTNPAATEAAVLGLARSTGHLHLIMGGEAKGADFSGLSSVCRDQVETIYLFGKDRDRIKKHLGADLSHRIQSFESLGQLIRGLSKQLAKGDQLLFSPGCASFDQFDNFEHRGLSFKSLVSEVLA